MAGHQDFLLVTSADYPLLHHIFLPARDVQQRPYTSSLPYRAKDNLFLVGAVPRRDSPRPDGQNEFDRLQAAALTSRLAFDIAVAPMGGALSGGRHPAPRPAAASPPGRAAV